MTHIQSVELFAIDMVNVTLRYDTDLIASSPLPSSQSSSVVLDIPQLQIKKGECLVICGQSGSGKSSLLRLLNGFIPEYFQGSVTGTIIINGKDMSTLTSLELSQNIGTIFQNSHAQFFHDKVEDELVFPQETKGMSEQHIDSSLKHVSQLFEVDTLLNRTIDHLSGGQKQTIAMSTIMMQQPDILLLDEPTANLDDASLLHVTTAIQTLKKLGKTLIMSDHHLQYVSQFADRFLYIQDGKIAHEWTPSQFINLSSDDKQALGLRHANTIDRNHYQLPLEQGDLTVRIADLPYQAQLHEQLSSIGFNAGEVSGLTGRNGVGKSTLFKVISGLMTSKSTHVSLYNTVQSPNALLQSTAWVMQDVQLQLFFDTVEKAITYGLSDLTQFEDIVTRLELNDLLTRHPLSLSGGQQQRVMIANALLSQKQVYLFDEVSSGLDLNLMHEVAQLIRQLKRDDRIIIVVSHDDELLTTCCDTIYEIN